MKNFFEQPIDDEMFKELLVGGSPWMVSWSILEKEFTKKGTQEIHFAFNEDKTGLSGWFSRISDKRIRPGPMKDIFVEEGRVSFISVVTGTMYNYSLMRDGTLNGFFIGASPRKYSFIGNSIAQPARLRPA